MPESVDSVFLAFLFRVYLKWKFVFRFIQLGQVFVERKIYRGVASLSGLTGIQSVISVAHFVSMLQA